MWHRQAENPSERHKHTEPESQRLRLGFRLLMSQITHIYVYRYIYSTHTEAGWVKAARGNGGKAAEWPPKGVTIVTAHTDTLGEN